MGEGRRELCRENRMETMDMSLGRVTSSQHLCEPRKQYPRREERLSIQLRTRFLTLYCMEIEKMTQTKVCKQGSPWSWAPKSHFPQWRGDSSWYSLPIQPSSLTCSVGLQTSGWHDLTELLWGRAGQSEGCTRWKGIIPPVSCSFHLNLLFLGRVGQTLLLVATLG